MKGQILDVYPEGSDTYRACVLEVIGGEDELAKVVDLSTGEIKDAHYYECENPVIDDIFAVEGE